MPTYLYTAKDGPGSTVNGEIIAANEADAVSRVEGMGYMPLSVSLRSVRSRKQPFAFPGRIATRDITVFTRQLAGMIRAGVPILTALETIRRQQGGGAMQAMLKDIEESVRDGNPMSDALAVYGRYFPELFVNMVRSGESGGVLDEVLLTLAEARESEDDIRKKVQSALAYPILMILVGIATVFVMISFLLPKIVPLIEGGKEFTALPGPTRLVIQISRFCEDYWMWGLGGMAVLVIGITRLLQTEAGKRSIHGLILKIPGIRVFVTQADIARFVRTLSFLERTAVPIDRALMLSGGILKNAVLRDEIEAVRKGTVQQGQSIAHGLEHAKHFPPFVANMVAVGEQSGNLEAALAEIGAFYDREMDYRIRIMTSLLEPMLILVVGGMVGFIVYAMMLPIFEIGRSLGI